jgi:hypothetical protein
MMALLFAARYYNSEAVFLDVFSVHTREKSLPLFLPFHARHAFFTCVQCAQRQSPSPTIVAA